VPVGTPGQLPCREAGVLPDLSETPTEGLPCLLDTG